MRRKNTATPTRKRTELSDSLRKGAQEAMTDPDDDMLQQSDTLDKLFPVYPGPQVVVTTYNRRFIFLLLFARFSKLGEIREAVREAVANKGPVLVHANQYSCMLFVSLTRKQAILVLSLWLVIAGLNNQPLIALLTKLI